MNIAMLGSGFIGRFYADSLQGYRSKDKIVTIYSRKEESVRKFAADYKVAFSTTVLEDAINRPEVEVVCISLPNNLHEEAVMLCCKFPDTFFFARIDRYNFIFASIPLK